jgi:hypothetical protein
MAADLHRYGVAQRSDLLDIRASFTLVGLERGSHHLLGALDWDVEVYPFAIGMDVPRLNAGLL